jgi:hypothetical protein
MSKVEGQTTPNMWAKFFHEFFQHVFHDKISD